MAAEFIENYPYDEIEPGQTAEYERTLTRDDIALFSKVSGDLNPTHVNEEYALRSGAKGAIGHSLWATGLISGLLANVLPGPGCAYRTQDVRFHCPVYLGDSLTARIKVREKKEGSIVVFDCTVKNQDRELVMDGVAEVVAATDRIRVKLPHLPEVSVQHHDSFRALLEAAERLEPIPTAVVHPCDQVSLSGAMEAMQDNFIRPILVGPQHKIRTLAEAQEIDLSGIELVDTEHSHAAAARAVGLVRAGEAKLLMKGSLHTNEVLGAVLHASTGIRTERRISHVFIMDVPTYPRLLMVTDAAVNIAPDLDVKRDICLNAIELAHTLGVEQPKVAILSAVEAIQPKLRSTLDAAALCKMADRGQIKGGLLDGPLAMDNAINLGPLGSKRSTRP